MTHPFPPSVQPPTCCKALAPWLWGLMLCAATASQAATDQAQARSAIEKTYRQERAACLDGSSPQARTICLKEAGAARAEMRRGFSRTGRLGPTLIALKGSPA